MNTKLKFECNSVVWEIVCSNENTAQIIAAGIERLEDEHGDGVRIVITVDATDEDVNI